MKIFALAFAFSFIAFFSLNPASASTLNAHDFGKNNFYNHQDSDGRFDFDKRHDGMEGRANSEFDGYEIGGLKNKLCDPRDNRWSDNDGRNHGSEKISYSWSPEFDHSDDRHNYSWSKISYPANSFWLTHDGDHHEYGHRVDGDHEEDGRKWLENYYRDICDHKKDNGYDPSRHCDPKDPGTAPLPGSFMLFAMALVLISLLGFRRQKTGRSI